MARIRLFDLLEPLYHQTEPEIKGMPEHVWSGAQYEFVNILLVQQK